MSFNMVFLAYIIVFSIILILGAFITKKWVSSSNDYLLAGREVGLVVNIFGVAAIGFAGTIITLGPGLAVLNGFWGSYGFGFAFLFCGLALYGIFFAPYIRRSGAHTLPEWLEMRFDSRTRVLITFTSIFGLLGIMANNVVSMAIVTTGFTGWSLMWTLAGIFFIFLLFTYIGGFWAVNLTDFIQMCIGLIAMPVLIISIITKHGGIGDITRNWPGANSFLTHGVNDGQLPILSFQYPSMLTFIILFGCFLVWGNNYYWLRVSSSRSEKVAKKSFVYAAILLAVGPYLILSLVGVYAGTYFYETFAPVGDGDPMAAYGVVLAGLPIGVASLALVGSLAASISTSTTALMGASSTAVRDIYQKFVKPKATSQQLVTPAKVITLILGLMVWLLTFYPGGPLYLFAFSAAWLGPPSLLVFLGMWWKGTTVKGAFVGAVVGITVTSIVTILDLMQIFTVSAYTHVGVIGLVFTLITTVAVSLLSKPNYYGAEDWKLNDGPIKGKSYSVSNEEKIVLELIYRNYSTMSEISDMLGVDSSVSNKLVEKLDQQRLLTREKLAGPGFYTFTLTDEGEEIAKKNVVFEVDELTSEELKFILKIGKGKDVFNNYIVENALDSLRVSAIFTKLQEQEYLVEKGLWRRQIFLSDKAKNIINEMNSKSNIG
ncbi:hypothetical protein QGM71_07650 [Virgibacillus sp. C22-A2]|uniref:Sodium:solute symporter n=1 Tax=Virgibacillus tibetensis TaxID=3042313 RepID=A0ABU6KEU0_9BACI|nr:hypothetical protein [Virgibacillus sp. C22-A2]